MTAYTKQDAEGDEAWSNDAVDAQLARDVELYGNSYEERLPDGTRRRIDPRTILIHELRTR